MLKIIMMIALFSSIWMETHGNHLDYVHFRKEPFKKKTMLLSAIILVNYLISLFIFLFGILLTFNSFLIGLFIILLSLFFILANIFLESFDNRARLLMLAILILFLMISILFDQFLLIVLFFVEIYVLDFNQRTIDLFEKD